MLQTCSNMLQTSFEAGWGIWTEIFSNPQNNRAHSFLQNGSCRTSSWPRVENSPASAVNMGSITGPGKIPHGGADKPLHHNLLSPCSATRGHCNKKPVHWVTREPKEIKVLKAFCQIHFICSVVSSFLLLKITIYVCLVWFTT